jgi:hypothetical protein
MGKHKHKHKNKRAEKHAQRQLDMAGPENKGQVENDTSHHASEQHGKDEQEPLMGLRNLAERSSLTDWLLAAFTFVLAACGIYQFIILNNQLSVMRKDQRPWMRISLQDGTVLRPLVNKFGTIQIINNGRTPARAISGSVVLQSIRLGEVSRFDYPNPHMTFTESVLFPNTAPVNMDVTRMHMSTGGTLEQDLLSQSEFDDFGKSLFFLVYGKVTYSDFHGIQHWTKFCAVIMPSDFHGFYPGKPCTDYNDIDTN